MNMKVLALILLFFSLNFDAQKLPVKPNQPDELAKHLSAAETYQISGDLVNAQIENRAIAAIGLQKFGNIYLEEGKLREAVNTLSQSKDYADNSQIRIDLAAAYIQLNETDKAQAEAEAAVAFDAKNASARYILGNIYYTKGDYAAALPELEKVIVLAPDFDSARALGLTYLHLKQLERAKLLFEEMQNSLKKDSADLHVVFGQAYEQTNYPLEAEREFKLALALDPKHPRTNLFLGYVILQYGGSDRLGEAGSAFEKELQLTPNDFFANFFAGVVASSENDHVKAVGLLQKAANLNPESSEANLFLGQSQMETGDAKTAEKSLRRAIELSVNASKNGFESRRTHYMLGRLLMANGKREEGEAELVKARDLQTKLIMTTRDELSALFIQVAGNTKKPAAENPADQKVVLPPEKIAELKKVKTYLSEILAQAYFNLGVIAVQSNRLPDALENFSAAAVWKPDFPNLDRSIGIVAFRSNEFAKAVAPLARQLKIAPQDGLARQMLGASDYFTGDFKNAVEVLKPIEATITDDSELAYFYGISLIKLERNQEATAIFEKLAQTSQKNPPVLTNVAQGFMLLGDYERAVKELRTVSAAAPNTPKANYFAGQSLIRLNRFDEAEQFFQKELALNPTDEKSKYHLALTFIERKIKTDDAIKLLNEAVALDPNYADAHYQLGKIYSEKGDTEKAVAELETAANADAQKDYIHYQLSIAYRKAGKKDDAARELKLYQQLKAENRKTDNLMPMGTDKNAP